MHKVKFTHKPKKHRLILTVYLTINDHPLTSCLCASLCAAVLFELMAVALGCVDVVQCEMIVQFSSVLMTGGGRFKHSQWLHFKLSNVSDITLALLSTKHISSLLLSHFDPVLPL